MAGIRIRDLGEASIILVARYAKVAKAWRGKER
jgi:hypothetical protein